MDDLLKSFGYLSLGTRFRRMGERLQAETQRIIEAQGFSLQVAQFPLLAGLDRLGPMTVGDLAAALGVSQPGVTRMLAQLEESQLIERRLSSDDRRCTLVALSTDGQALVDRASIDLWPRIEASVRALCEEHGTGLLNQIAGIEAGLSERSLLQRAGRQP